MHGVVRSNLVGHLYRYGLVEEQIMFLSFGITLLIFLIPSTAGYVASKYDDDLAVVVGAALVASIIEILFIIIWTIAYTVIH